MKKKVILLLLRIARRLSFTIASNTVNKYDDVLFDILDEVIKSLERKD